ncbi:MAG: type II toxin-antitoxin system HicB family antitoxin [Oscillospiraceae bacterium]|jgi:predicted RNase H-like HicB family nuclease|nr:type II toxin-antitoxin system HicB family antitoxin [Oscillospiraceae bacterium]
MKNAYPIVMSKGKKYIVVYVPDFDCNTQGKNYAEAIEMARDCIGLMGIDYQDKKKALPQPSAIENVEKEAPDDVVTLVDVDFSEYRRKNDARTVRRNVTLPSWLDYKAEQSGINVSALLQRALKQELHIADR